MPGIASPWSLSTGAGGAAASPNIAVTIKATLRMTFLGPDREE
jgi:hypothetical protein